MIQSLVPNLWFNACAKEAVDYYLSIFPEGNVLSTTYYPNSTQEGLAEFQRDLAGKELAITFVINGMQFVAINADDHFQFTEAISFAITCENQEEIDYYWGKLSHVPDAEQCGWCKDRYGLSWQIVPANMEELLQRPGAFAKLMDMKKVVIEGL